MFEQWFSLVAERSSDLWLRTGEHLELTGIATGIAVAAGIPLGVLAARIPWLRGGQLGAVGILQTIPSLAMLAILLAVLGKIGATPAIIALTLYALLPIVRNTLAGLEGVPTEINEAGEGIGMTRGQQLWMVQIPLALPIILAGVRTAAVVGVGIATLSAFIGAGGLGQFINRGLALSNTDLILLGAVPAAILAMFVDFTLGVLEWGLRPTRQGDKDTWLGKAKPLALCAPLTLLAIGIASAWSGGGAPAQHGVAGKVTIGSKNFTEQLVLGELMAQVIEADTGLWVDRRFNLGGTMICHGALANGQIDLYAEYTGTGLTAILEEEVISDPDRALEIVREQYLRRFQAEWLGPFGFNNTYAVTVRGSDARGNGWKTISDLEPDASSLRAGFTAEFAERADGYPGLRTAYGFAFGEVRDFDPALMYEAIANNEVDVICAFATDGRIAAFKLQPLVDDRGFFPPYHAAPVVRSKFLAVHPEVRGALDALAGVLDDASMQRLNYEVDEKKRSPREVAREFLVSCGLLPEATPE